MRWRQEQLLEARIAFERALEFYGDTDGLGTAETLLQLADLMALSLGQHADADRCATRALAMVRRLGDDRLAALAIVPWAACDFAPTGWRRVAYFWRMRSLSRYVRMTQRWPPRFAAIWPVPRALQAI